jgi:hypothetical protein
VVRNQRDSRLEVIEEAVATAKSYERKLRLRLLSVNMAAAGLEVKSPGKSGQGHFGSDPLDDGMYGGMSFGSASATSRKRPGFAHMV